MTFRKSPSAGGSLDEVDATVTAQAVADVARQELFRLEKAGRLTPEQVVESAKPKASPLHDYFEWDDAEAASAHRLDQARRLIRSIRIIVEDKVTILPTYVRDVSLEASEAGYKRLDRVKRDPAEAAVLAAYELNRALAHLRRALAIASALDIKSEATSIAKRIEAVLAKLG